MVGEGTGGRGHRGLVYRVGVEMLTLPGLHKGLWGINERIVRAMAAMRAIGRIDRH